MLVSGKQGTHSAARESKERTAQTRQRTQARRRESHQGAQQDDVAEERAGRLENGVRPLPPHHCTASKTAPIQPPAAAKPKRRTHSHSRHEDSRRAASSANNSTRPRTRRKRQRKNSGSYRQQARARRACTRRSRRRTRPRRPPAGCSAARLHVQTQAGTVTTRSEC